MQETRTEAVGTWAEIKRVGLVGHIEAGVIMKEETPQAAGGYEGERKSR